MPIYIYKCEACECEIKINHSMTEEIYNCDLCQTKNSLVKQLSNFSYFKKEEKKNKTGTIVKEFIKDAHKEIKQQKEQLEKERRDR